MRLQAEVDQLGVFRIVIVLCGFHPGVGKMVDFRPQPELLGSCLCELCKLQNGELLRELVEHSALAPSRRIEAGNLDATDSVADVQEASGLSALAINRQRVTDSSLGAEAVQDGAENFVVVEPVAQRFA